MFSNIQMIFYSGSFLTARRRRKMLGFPSHFLFRKCIFLKNFEHFFGKILSNFPSAAGIERPHGRQTTGFPPKPSDFFSLKNNNRNYFFSRKKHRIIPMVPVVSTGIISHWLFCNKFLIFFP